MTDDKRAKAIRKLEKRIGAQQLKVDAAMIEATKAAAQLRRTREKHRRQPDPEAVAKASRAADKADRKLSAQLAKIDDMHGELRKLRG